MYLTLLPVSESEGIAKSSLLLADFNIVLSSHLLITIIFSHRTLFALKVVKKDEDVKVIEVVGDDDWLSPPPKIIFKGGVGLHHVAVLEYWYHQNYQQCSWLKHSFGLLWPVG
ncbi:hypothetical protein F2Q68_00020476 [Brassica cretica]|uniref:Uncharacterized protein n=1 Tax=Brassica cretica TaxID=69181 RepID=A0A8S9FWR7_BRACR|nr:hypothetical protein F2Q68_00020476 [Brassica cretica]